MECKDKEHKPTPLWHKTITKMGGNEEDIRLLKDLTRKKRRIEISKMKRELRK